MCSFRPTARSQRLTPPRSSPSTIARLTSSAKFSFGTNGSKSCLWCVLREFLDDFLHLLVFLGFQEFFEKHGMDGLTDDHVPQLPFRRVILTRVDEVIKRLTLEPELFLRLLEKLLNPSEKFLLIHLFWLH